MIAQPQVRSLFAAFALLSMTAFCQTTAQLHTQQTSIRLEALENAPHLKGLESNKQNVWINQASEPLLPFLWMGEKRIPLTWELKRGESHSDAQQVRFVYESKPIRLRLTWEWQVRAVTGPIEHTIHIENLSSNEVWIPLQDSLRFAWKANASKPLRTMYIDKGAGKPTAIGTHDDAIPAGYQWEGRSSTYALDAGPREIIPWIMVQRPESQSGWYAGIEFSGRTRIDLKRDAASLSGAIGLDPEPALFRTRLAPGATFDTPTVFVGAFDGGADGLGNVLRPWVRHVLTNPETWKNPNYPLLVNNSWGSGMEVDEELSKRMIRDSAELGLDMFHIDAGWFRGVGDWYPDQKKFPHGLAVISDYAHAHGLKFGIWVNWAEAGIDTSPGAINVHDPKFRDWLIADVPASWKPEPFVGLTMDLGALSVHNYAAHEVQRIVQDYKLDMLEHDGYVVAKSCVRSDHPHAAPSQSSITSVTDRGLMLPIDANSTDVSYHATRSYYDIYSQLRKKHPDLLLEVCDDGGRMVDFGSASHGDYFSITDSYDPVSNRQAFYDASHVLPSAMLEDYVEKWPTPKVENFLYMLRSGMMGWLTIMQDTNAWTAEQHALAKEEFATYKKSLRPLIRDANLYHVSPRPDGVHWDGIEYFNPQLEHGVVYAFRGTTHAEDDHVFHLQGLQPDRKYRISFHDHSAPDRTASGRDLMRSGLVVHLRIPDSSELVFLSPVR
jgi:melibiase-like protein/glycosyl hydrolase family 36